MRTLAAPLLEAQRSSSSVPHLKVTLSDRIGGIRRVAFARLYTGSEPDGYHAAAMPGDSSLMRARSSGGRLYYQRVANPGAGSNFASTVHPGDSGLTAVRRLLATVPDVVFVRGEFAFLTEPLATEATDYAYGTQTGTADHAVLAGRYADDTLPANRAQVFGNAVFGERFDWAGVQAVYDRLRQVDDRNLTTVAQVQTRADAVLRAAAVAGMSGEILVPVNCSRSCTT